MCWQVRGNGRNVPPVRRGYANTYQRHVPVANTRVCIFGFQSLSRRRSFRVACKFDVQQLLCFSLCLAAHRTRVSRRRMVFLSRAAAFSLKKQKACRAREPVRVIRSLAHRSLRLCSATVHEISIEYFLDRNVDTLPFPLPLSPFNPSRHPFLFVLSSFFFSPSSLFFPIFLSFPSPFILPLHHRCILFSLHSSVYVPNFLLSSSFSPSLSLSLSRFTPFPSFLEYLAVSPSTTVNPPGATRTWFPHQRKLFVNEA